MLQLGTLESESQTDDGHPTSRKVGAVKAKGNLEKKGRKKESWAEKVKEKLESKKMFIIHWSMSPIAKHS